MRRKKSKQKWTPSKTKYQITLSWPWGTANHSLPHILMWAEKEHSPSPELHLSEHPQHQSLILMWAKGKSLPSPELHLSVGRSIHRNQHHTRENMCCRKESMQKTTPHKKENIKTHYAGPETQLIIPSIRVTSWCEKKGKSLKSPELHLSEGKQIYIPHHKSFISVKEGNHTEKTIL